MRTLLRKAPVEYGTPPARWTFSTTLQDTDQKWSEIWDWVTLDEGMIYPPDNTTKNGEYLSMPISQELVKIAQAVPQRSAVHHDKLPQSVPHRVLK
jgi:hypothetical protein